MSSYSSLPPSHSAIACDPLRAIVVNSEGRKLRCSDTKYPRYHLVKIGLPLSRYGDLSSCYKLGGCEDRERERAPWGLYRPQGRASGLHVQLTPRQTGHS